MEIKYINCNEGFAKKACQPSFLIGFTEAKVFTNLVHSFLMQQVRPCYIVGHDVVLHTCTVT